MIAPAEGLVWFYGASAGVLASLSIPYDTVERKGHSFSVIPHTMHAVTLLQNMGRDIPSPILWDYKWPGLYAPYAHQRATAAYLSKHPKCFCLNEPGTGKTASAAWAADYLMQVGLVKKVLVLCPLSCVSQVWLPELFKTITHRRSIVLTGDRKTKTSLLSDTKAQFVVTNHDSVTHLQKELMAANFDLVIVDESTAFKSETAHRTKALKAVVKGKRLWAMTGTPTSQNPIDGYLMCKLVNPAAPQSASTFQALTMIKVSTFKWVAKSDAAKTVAVYMRPAIRFAKSDCLDLPPVTRISHKVDLTPIQAKVVKDIKDDWLTDRVTNGEMITAMTAGIRFGKLMQVMQGIIIGGPDRAAYEIDNEPRIAACKNFIDQSVGKTIIFGTYRAGLAKLTRELRGTYGAAAIQVVDGSVSETARTRIFNAFQNDSSVRVLIAHPKVAAHGVTLTAATTTVWYGPTLSGELDEQANNRMDRPGQIHPMLVVDLWSTPEERAVYDGLKSKSDMQKVLLDIVRNATV